MLDSGASCDMFRDKTMLSGAKKIASVAIGLPNGTHTMANEMGLTNLGESLQLKNVLYVPNLKCNLVSFSKLCKPLNCAVTCLDDFCVTQDRTLRTLIRAGELREGVILSQASVYPTSKCNECNLFVEHAPWASVK